MQRIPGLFSIKEVPGKSKLKKGSLERNLQEQELFSQKSSKNLVRFPTAARFWQENIIMQNLARFALVVRNLQATSKIWIQIRLESSRVLKSGWNTHVQANCSNLIA